MKYSMVLKSSIAVLTMILLLVPSADASGYYDGYTEDGYVYRTGYWWKAGYAYTRTKEYTGETYDYGRGRYYRYCYYLVKTEVPVATVPVAVPVYKSRDWKERMVERDRDYEDHLAFLEASKQRGYNGTVRLGNLGVGYPLVGQVQGATQYGYPGYGMQTTTYQSQRTTYGSLDTNALVQGYLRAVASAQGAGSQAVTELGGLTTQVTTDQARLAEIDRRADALALLARSIDPQARSTQTQTQTQTTPVPLETRPMARADGAALTDEDFQVKVVTPACVQCHGGAKPAGGLVLTSYAKLSDEVKEKVLERIYHTDPGKRMPRGGDGTAPGAPLAPAYKREFAKH